MKVPICYTHKIVDTTLYIIPNSTMMIFDSAQMKL